jgi:hypothetical protein
MVANCASVETCTQDTVDVVECDLMPLEEHLPMVWLMSRLFHKSRRYLVAL